VPSTPVQEALELPGLYLHIPFCRAICPYCDFAVSLGDAAKRAAFCDTLLAEIDLVGSEELPGNELNRPSVRFGTIYFGGGTPSALTSEQLADLIERLRCRFPISDEVEIYLEANPEDVTAENAAAWRSLGVDFLSLGVQSFDRERLRFLGRSHDGEGATRAVEIAQDAGFRTVSIDLIFGLPEDQRDGWQRDLDAAVALKVDHLSCYQLTIHEQTAFGHQRARGELVELSDVVQAELFEMAHADLASAGLEGYEVSNFSRGREHRSVHNQKYWHHVPYIGLGPSAHSFDGRRRWWNRRGFASWASAIEAGRQPVEEEETLTGRQLVLERLMLGLRTIDGVDLRRLEERYGVPIREQNDATLRELAHKGLLSIDGDRVAPTRIGMAVADSLVRAVDLSD